MWKLFFAVMLLCIAIKLKKEISELIQLRKLNKELDEEGIEINKMYEEAKERLREKEFNKD